MAACSTKLLPFLSLLLFFTVLLNVALQVTLAGRSTPATGGSPSKTQTARGNINFARTQTHANKKQLAEAADPGSKGNRAAGSNPDVEKAQTDCFDDAAGIPGVGRFMVGSQPHEAPTVGGTFLGDSVPAAINAQYIPGYDDTFVPNPGYEVPNPFRRSVNP